MSARLLLERLNAQGVSVSLDGEDVCLAVEPPQTIEQGLVAEIRALKAEVVAELRRLSQAEREHDDGQQRHGVNLSGDQNTSALGEAKRSQRGMVCRLCRRVDRCYADAEGPVCPSCVEWQVRGCPGFAVLTTADTEAEMRFGACLRCGSPWAMHGRPDADLWARYADLDDVVPATIRFVLARAREIARGSQ